MIEKIILCQHPYIEDAPSDFLCSAFLIFKENHPLVHAYCEISHLNGDLSIHTTGWSITDESLIKKIQMYVRNKMDVIKAEKIPTFNQALKQKDAFLIKQGRGYEVDFEEIELTDEERLAANESHPELEALEKEFQEQMQSIIKNVNAEWKQ